MAPAVTLGLSRISSVVAEADATGGDWLSESELNRLAQMCAPRRRDEFVAARLALRRLLAATHGGDPLRDWPLDAPENAPPRLVSRSSPAPIHLGLSHSGDWLLCAAAAFPVGVDIERIGAARDYAGLSGMVCSPAEQRRLAVCAPHEIPLQFTMRWTLKEAWLKARGEGIASRSLQAIETEPEPMAPNAWLWRMDDAVLALCLPSDLPAATWVFKGEVRPGDPQAWRVQAT